MVSVHDRNGPFTMRMIMLMIGSPVAFLVTWLGVMYVYLVGAGLYIP
jgi:hypothetical protein